MSAAFNRVLDERLAEGSIDQLESGDRAWKHDTRVTFPVTMDMIASGELKGRLASFEISPSGPLWGKGMPRASGRIDAMEVAALDAVGVDEESVGIGRYRPESGRRPLRTKISNLELQSGHDEHGPMIHIAFDLPRGMYATVLLRELMKNDQGERG